MARPTGSSRVTPGSKRPSGLGRPARRFRVARYRVTPTPVAVKTIALHDDKGRWIGQVDPLSGRLFTRKSYPVRFNKGLYKRLRAAADDLGYTASASVKRREEEQEKSE